ncbi:aspartic peptidase domain-containing protein [Suillus spraguei]|nr:aspartic peptidase domain-containing protein [Suillus spraguei]
MMFPAASLWTLLALSISITGSPVEVRNSRIILPMTSKLHFSNGTNLVQRDDAQRIDVTSDDVDWFSCVTIGVGVPPTFYRLTVSTGSAITWIGADRLYRPTGTAFNSRRPMRITYPSSFFAGMIYNNIMRILFADTVEITDGYTIDGMDIGVATPETRGASYDGMLGIGPRTLSRGSIPTQPERTLATVTERLWMQGSIAWPLVGLFFRPSTQVYNGGGRLVFGEEHPGFDIGNIGYTFRTNTMPAASQWGIDQRIVYGNTEVLQLTAGVVDSATTFIWIASDAYDRYKTLTRANYDPRTGMLSITPRQYRALWPLQFHIGGQIYNLSPNGQIWPRWLNYQILGTDEGIYLIIKSLNRPTGSGIDFCLGYVFLQRFYSVFDAISSRVGFATTPYTDATTN